MNNFTFLSDNQIFDNQLSILKKYGTKCAISDFAILLGGYVGDNCYTSEGDDLIDRATYWWTSTENGPASARVVIKYGYSF